MKILMIRFGNLRNEAHYQFLFLLKKMFETCPGVAAIINTLLQQFNPLITLEGVLIDSGRAGEYTRQLAKASCEGRDLIFGYDYDVADRHNDRPGNACVTLHGKGTWKSKKNVSFNIVAP